MAKQFSIPINTKISEEFVENTFIPFLKQYNHLIYDLYFTCRMPPFIQDAMGDTIDGDMRETTYNALYISEQTGIPLSATFNNIQVIPSQENLDIFIMNFRPLYEAGIRIVTIPHTSWIMTGQIQKEFPELFIKNTILREVTRPNEIVNLAKAGFHYINLDRDLMRDRDQLNKIMEAKEYCASIGKPVKISLLANEWCWGGCPIMPEHYHYNMTRRPDNPQYFHSEISRISCSSWDEYDPATALKAATLPPWKKDWQEFLDLGIDVFKMHGRENAMRLMETMDIVKRWDADEDLLYPQFNDYIEDVTLEEKPIDIWREKIKTCGFDCWKCNYCDSVVHSRMKRSDREMDSDVKLVLESIDKAARHESNFVEEEYKYPGLSSNKVRHFLNNLCSKEDTVYLELGVYAGSTFFAATMNRDITCFAIDDYSQGIVSPFREDVVIQDIGSPKEKFFRGLKENQYFYEKTITDLDGQHFIGKNPNIIFYDADHDPQKQFDNLTYLLPVFADQFILVVDDANFMGVVQSAEAFAKENNLNIVFDRKILTTVPEDANSWWNGIHIMVLRK
jgi:hypothetical protein